MVCGADFSANNPDVVVAIGKEHIGWYSVFPEESTIQLLHKGDYEVGPVGTLN